MLIFNTTFLVSDKVHGAWIKWVHEKHIPFMLDSGFFSLPQVAKIIANEEQEGTSFSVQFHVLNMDMLILWNNEYGAVFQESFSQMFGTEALFFTTVLELLEY
jgi:hypothetical protein